MNGKSLPRWRIERPRNRLRVSPVGGARARRLREIKSRETGLPDSLGFPQRRHGFTLISMVGKGVYLIMISRGTLLLLASGIALVYWATKPVDRISFDRSCNLIDLQPKISEMLYGDSFWRVQLAAADEALVWLQRAPAADARDKDQQSRNSVEERMTRLSDRQATTPEAQEEVRQREQKERYDQMAWLTSCDTMIRLKLNH